MTNKPTSLAAARPSPRLILTAATFLTLLVMAVLLPLKAFAQESPPAAEDRPVLGILGFSAADGSGVRVAQVPEGTGADEAGLEVGDLINDIEGTSITSLEDLTSALEGFGVGDTVTVTFLREGESQSVEVELGSSRQARREPFQMPDFNPRFPETPQVPGAPESPDLGRDAPGSTEADYMVVFWLFGTLITGALVALIVLMARKNQTPVVAAGTGTGTDPLEILRLRYARGEINREEFLTASSDLGGSAAPGSESPTQEL